MHRLILLRHGESQWNKENRFTGWTDVDLSEEGIREARRAALLMKSFRIDFDVIFASYLRRAIKTANIVADEMDRLWVPQFKDWRLNERHYGALQGLNKKETALRYGEEQVQRWRRSYQERPPLLGKDDPRCPQFDSAYEAIDPGLLPRGESLADTIERVLPYWQEEIIPVLATGKAILIAAHGNSLRALIMHLLHLSQQEVVGLEVPTGVPYVFELDVAFRPLKHYYLG